MTTAIASASATPVMGQKLSIITVCLNEVESIRKTADSVARQTCRNFEWIVIDGGSKDGTLEILREYQDRITHLISGPDGGVYNAMNKGAGLASGEWFLFLNGGDRLATAKVIEGILPLLGEQGDDIVVGEFLCVWPDERPPRHRSYENHLDLHHFYRRSVNHQSAFIGRKVFERFGPYDVSFKLLADHDFFVRAVLGGILFRYTPSLIAEYDMTGISAEMKRSKSMLRERKRVRKLYPLNYRIRRFCSDVVVACQNCLKCGKIGRHI